MNPTYFPPYSVLKAGVVGSSDGRVISMSRELFIKLVGAAIGPSFDPIWYKSEYPDISPAVEDGSVEDELDHFVALGYSEGRKPHYFVVDEGWYVSNYSDVVASIESGDFVDAEAHFNAVGYDEGRAADETMLRQAQQWAEAISVSARTVALGVEGEDLVKRD